MTISRFLYTNSQNKTQCASFFTGTCKTEHNTDRPFILGSCKNVSISILFQKVRLSWKLSPIINRRGGGWNNPGRKTIEKLISRVSSIKHITLKEYITLKGTGKILFVLVLRLSLMRKFLSFTVAFTKNIKLSKVCVQLFV